MTEQRTKNVKLRTPFLIVELVLAPGKRVKVPLFSGDEGGSDDADQIVKRVATTFNLSRKAKEALREVV